LPIFFHGSEIVIVTFLSGGYLKIPAFFKFIFTKKGFFAMIRCMKINKIFKLAIAIIIPQLFGVIGSLFTVPSIPNWYVNLSKPTFNPPAWIFAPVWTILFIMMGVAAFLIWSAHDKTSERQEKMAAKLALVIFIVQLALNAFWSIIFFGMHNPGGALVEIVFLWLAILATIIAFFKISKPAAWLLVPYILWVSFASFLNFSIWQLNH
jgi:translocator protein